ncbi:MAG: DUF2442 domain-containing protein [Steroidobacteraceae bacterium]
MSGGKAVRIKKVEYAGEGLQLRVRWANGKTTAVDLHEPVHRLKGLRPRRDPKFFARVKLGEGGHSIAWPGDVDMGGSPHRAAGLDGSTSGRGGRRR